ncbi:GlxA family transcriptional regulator [Micromonospora chaiyaphumensis]|uniref:Transcriptional regulator GlxA family, contains an amidase domain and an AraC-type DNA-binding HTH domain n=1 Tax=Micromonospora chaiyaphumensis TaxID=307119 RepID=A0A1C4TWR2_9ACTN|nr:helix-turn-helix domain-containing protein [Micromonospora chaiyaphumensis]SCE63834.1 Transcriptional regulator GlxA family, contains an amidase domain and an AraC-type DNA-binding HTH domain [Micromonospora chaiyaphumensis]
MHAVAVAAFDGVVGFDLATALEVFGRARLPGGAPAYRVTVCAERREVDAGSFVLRAPGRLDALIDADTVIVPGIADLAVPTSAPLLKAVRTAAARGVRVASICVGAFILAEAGLLDGRRATTHWSAAAELARRHPTVTVEENLLYVDEGDVLTSAGAAAGLDLCLHMVRRDHGAAVAAEVARASVMPLERAGGQAQFITHEPPTASGSLAPLLQWLAGNAVRDIDLDDMAAQAAVSVRTLLRRFRAQTGTTPMQWLTHHRVRRAQHLLETSDLPVERVGQATGFASATTFRDRFKELVGVSPSAYRRTFSAN